MYFGINTVPSWQTVLAAEKIDKGRGCFQVDRVHLRLETWLEIITERHCISRHHNAAEPALYASSNRDPVLALPIMQPTVYTVDRSEALRYGKVHEVETHCTFPLCKSWKASQNMYFYK